MSSHLLQDKTAVIFGANGSIGAAVAKAFAAEGAKVSIAMAVIGPTPGIVCRRRVMALRLARHAIAFSSPATFSESPSI